MQEEIERKLKSQNAYCHSVQNLLYSSLLSKKCKDKIYITIIFVCCCMYGGEERCVQGFGGKTWVNDATWKTQAKMGG
jgi:hypothetical protein